MIINPENYIIAIEKSDSNFDMIVSKINNAPKPPSSYTYKLRADNLEWELVKLPEPEPVDEDAVPEDYEKALEELGVDFSD